MDIEEVREYCLSLKGTNESFPFDDTALVFKAITKMYCLIGLDKRYMNIKAKPERVIELIEEYSSISPGWHMNKKHWVTVELDHFPDNELLKELIKNSYMLIVQKMTKKDKEILKQL